MAVAMLRAAWGQEKESGGANGGVQLPKLHRVYGWVVLWPWGEVRRAISTDAGPISRRRVVLTEVHGIWRQTEQSQDASGIR
jgi:hypothetical protein